MNNQEITISVGEQDLVVNRDNKTIRLDGN